MNPVCLLVAGVVRATLPAPEFTLAWDHSVQKTRWEERYRQHGDGLQLVEARVQGTGAGMEPPPSAVLRDGWWTWQPGTDLPELRLTLAPYTPDYTLCWQDRCQTLGALVGPAAAGGAVVVRPCVDTTAGHHARAT
ncbi:MAG: DUF1850 domain-containing protein [Aromatoleum sp.]|nr:DUF1850 domain-containing protein [Aromatoleum sp.]